MQSPSAAHAALNSNAHAPVTPAAHNNAFQNGVSRPGPVQEPDNATEQAQSSSSLEASDAIREGKEKAKAVMAAYGSNGEQANTPARSQSPAVAADGANGVPQGRKRSRSGSIITSQRASSADDSHEQPNIQEYLLHKYIERDMIHSAALNTQQDTFRRKVIGGQLQEVNYLKEVHAQRRKDPGSVFGYGYQGFGNERTDSPQGPRLLYPAQRRPAGRRRTRPLRIDRKHMGDQADQLEELVPVRLDVDFEKLKLRDTFTWNLHDRVTGPQRFAETLVEDFRLPPDSSMRAITEISKSIDEQVQNYYPHVFIEEEPLDPHLPYSAYKNDDMRILIKLNITIGSYALVDQFEWDINNPLNSPEEFARQMTREMSLSGEFTTAIAHSIREQCQMYTQSLYISGHPFDGRPIEDPDVRDALLPTPVSSVFRSFNSAKEFSPVLYEVNEGDLERTELSVSREQRRQKRGALNRRGGLALPDLKERQRTIRTLLVSDVLPGAAKVVEESRLYKITRSSGRSRMRPGRDGDSDEESDSDESMLDSPAPSMQMAAGTSRQRAMRGAANAAQAAMRANLGRSATPEIATLHHHETRRSARSLGLFESKEESEEPADLIVKFKFRNLKDRYRNLVDRLHSGRTTRSSGGRLGLSQSNTPQRDVSATSSMPPPPSPAPASRGTPGAGSSTDGGQQIRYYPDGRVDAPHPQPHDSQTPPAPPWLTTALRELQREHYPHDSYSAIMRYSAIDKNTNAPVRADQLPPGNSTDHIKYQWLPRIRCNDCPGKLYTAGPEQTLENFKVHCENRSHRANVDSQRNRGQ